MASIVSHGVLCCVSDEFVEWFRYSANGVTHELDNYYCRVSHEDMQLFRNSVRCRVVCLTSLRSGWEAIRRAVVSCVTRDGVYRVIVNLVSCVPRIYGVTVGNLAICRSIVCPRSSRRLRI